MSIKEINDKLNNLRVKSIVGGNEWQGYAIVKLSDCLVELIEIIQNDIVGKEEEDTYSEYSLYSLL